MAMNTQLFNGMIIFVEVIHSGSFTQAALNTGHSTSYVSKEINKLESRLGIRLIHRTTRSLRLTPEGELYFKQCQQIISDASELEQALSGEQLEPQGSLKISCPISFGLARLQPLFAEFMHHYPKVNLDIDLSNRKVDLIGEGFDLVIRASHQLDDSSLMSRKLVGSRGMTLAAPSYLQQHGTPSHPSELSQHQTISYSLLKQPMLWSYENKDGHSFQVAVKSRVLTNSSELELSLCIAGEGISRLPEFMLGDEIERGQLVELFCDWPSPVIDVYIIYPSRKHLSTKVRCFIDFMVQRVK